jgi:hypothetical protein
MCYSHGAMRVCSEPLILPDSRSRRTARLDSVVRMVLAANGQICAMVSGERRTATAIVHWPWRRHSARQISTRLPQQCPVRGRGVVIPGAGKWPEKPWWGGGPPREWWWTANGDDVMAKEGRKMRSGYGNGRVVAMLADCCLLRLRRRRRRR